MTNEEIIRHTRYLAKKYKDDTVLTFETNFHLAFTDIANHIEEQVEENTKLKAEIDRLNTQIAELNQDGVSILHDILELREENEKLRAELERSVKFEKYFMELYNEGLEVVNWHLNGSLEPLTNFIDSALDEKEN